VRYWDLVPFPAPTEATLHAICERHALPQPTVRLPSNGAINSIWVLGDELVLRIPKNMEEGWKDTLTESVAAPVAFASGMRTPALIVFDETLELVEVPFTVYERIDGEAGGPTDRGGWCDLGREVALLHERVMSCPDPLGRLDDATRWCDPDVLTSHAASREGISAELADRIRSTLIRLEPAVTAAAAFRRFLHNDLHAGNLMAQGGDHVAVIDWGDAGWGDPAREASNVPLDAVPAFLDGYREVMPFDDDATVDDRVRWDRLLDAALGGDSPDLEALHALLDDE
jgi:hypothetical protein